MQTPSAETESRFNQLAEQWERETMIYSMPWQILGHDNYKALCEMGTEILPLIFQRQEAKEGLSIGWFEMLHTITGEIPVFGEQVAPGFIGVSIPEMNRAWREWALEHGYALS